MNQDWIKVAPEDVTPDENIFQDVVGRSYQANGRQPTQIELMRNVEDPIVLGGIFLHILQETLGMTDYVHVNRHVELRKGDSLELTGGRSEPVLQDSRGRVLAVLFSCHENL